MPHYLRSVFFLQPGLPILQTGSGNFGEIQLFKEIFKKSNNFENFSKISENMIHSKTELGPNSKNGILFWRPKN